MLRKFHFKCVLMFFLLGLCCYVSRSWAGQDVDFEVTVDSKQVEVGQALQLNVTLHGVQSAEPLRLPPIDGFESRYLGPETQVQFINGQQTSQITFMYSLAALKVGQFTIPSLELTFNGQTFHSDPISVDVVKMSTPAAGNNGQGVAGSSLSERLFLVMGTPKREGYLNEKIPLTIKFLNNGVSLQEIRYPEFSHEGFLVDPWQEPKRYEQVIDGVRYGVAEFKTNIYPTRVGELSLGPAQEVVNVVFQDQKKSNRSADPFDRFFGDSVFDSVFNNYDVRSMQLASTDLKMNVRALPDEGKPNDFSGAIGQFDFDVQVSPPTVKVGDPLTVRLQISGEGNLNNVQLPTINDSQNFKTYEPQTKEENGRIVSEQVYIPKNDKISEIPALTFSYFDVVKGAYATITKGPFPIKVEPLSEAEALKVVGAQLPVPTTAVFEQKETLGQDIRFIKEHPGRWRKVAEPIFANVFFVLGAILYLIIWTALLVTHFIQRRLKLDVKLARRLQAPRYARSGLQQAKLHMQKGEQKDFYDTLFKTLQNYFSHRLHVSTGAITVDLIKQQGQARAIKEDVFEGLRSVFNDCEMVRFASTQTDREKMQKSLQQTQEIIDHFERRWR